MHDGSITIRLLAEVKDIERLNRLVRQFGELHEIPGRALYAVNLALDEVVTNIVLYAYDDAGGQEVLLRLEVAGQELHCEVVDKGREFDPGTIPSPDLNAPLHDRELGGLGIHLVRSLMDRVSYRRHESKNVLTMAKRIR